MANKNLNILTTFNHEEKLAIIYMSYAVVYADGIVHKGEVAAIHQLKFAIGFDTDYISAAQVLGREKALISLYNMAFEKKQALSKILRDIAISDNHLHEKEVTLIIDTFKSIGIGEELE